MSDALIHALQVDASGVVRHLDQEAVRRWRPGDGLLWLHLNSTHADARVWLSEQPDLPAIALPALLAVESRPRVSAVGDGIVMSLRGVNLNPGAEPEDMVAIRVWADAHRVISTRRRRLLSVPDIVESLEHTPLTGTGDLLVRLADRLVERMSDVIDGLEDRVSDLERRIIAEPDQSIRSTLAELRREAIALRRYLAPQREALGRLYGEPLSWLTDHDRLRLREVNDRLIRYLEDLDAVRERAAVIQEELISQLSDQLNKRMYMLSIVAAMFLPLGFLTGLLGINVGGIPGADSPYGFLAFTLLLTVLVGMQLWFFIRKRWF